MSPTRESYKTIDQADVPGWEFQGVLPEGLVPVEIFKRNTAVRAWAQVADTRSNTLTASVFGKPGAQAIGVTLNHRPRLKREERGKAVDGFPEHMPMEAVPTVELPSTPLTDGNQRDLGLIYPNPAHGTTGTQIYADFTEREREGVSYIGLRELKEIITLGGVDARLLASILLLRAKFGVILDPNETESGPLFLERLRAAKTYVASVVSRHTYQAGLGIAHVVAGWNDDRNERHEQLVRVENGTVAAPGMCVPESVRHDNVPQIGVVDNWRPLIGGNGVWQKEIPGGFDGWKKELHGEFGVEANASEARMLPSIIADPTAEGYDIDVRAVSVNLHGQQELDSTEVGMMNGPGWITPESIMECTKNRTVADGRTMAIFQMIELLRGAN